MWEHNVGAAEVAGVVECEGGEDHGRNPLEVIGGKLEEDTRGSVAEVDSGLVLVMAIDLLGGVVFRELVEAK